MTALLNSPELPTLLSTTRSRLAACYKIVVDTLTELGIEVFPSTAGLWLNAKVKDAETADVIEKGREKGVIVGRGTEFNGVEGENGWIKITFALPEEILKEGMERLKAALGPASKA
jgi:aspartate/methionine/tyrosine aminotransferase